MAGTLFVVATPIGHLDDMSPRALRVLREAALVAAEDTRRTGNLLRHFGITNRILSLYQHNERSRSAEIVGRLERGESVALVSDAGTPGISDPGAELVRLARERHIRVEPVPGPSAVAAAVSVAGLEDPAFGFLGFPPVRSKDRKAWFERLERVRSELAVVFFESPHRIQRTLSELDVFVKQPITVLRELTKLHEEALVGPPGDVLERLTTIQGEFTVVIPPRPAPVDTDIAVDPTTLRHEIGQLIENGVSSRREAARQVGLKFGLSTKFVYEHTKD
ncbi:MAG: 16S rRNA (cytidine(1402)-2'-O)-methyltransferase [Vicinamibacterales bacterium]